MMKALLAVLAAALAVGGMTLATYAQEGGAPPPPPKAASTAVTLTADQQAKLAAQIKAFEDALKALKDQALIILGDKDGKAFVAQKLTKEAQAIDATAAAATPPPPPPPATRKGVKGAKPAGGKPARGGGEGGGEG